MPLIKYPNIVPTEVKQDQSIKQSKFVFAGFFGVTIIMFLIGLSIYQMFHFTETMLLKTLANYGCSLILDLVFLRFLVSLLIYFYVGKNSDFTMVSFERTS
jgi:hypothetical protein